MACGSRKGCESVSQCRESNVLRLQANNNDASQRLKGDAECFSGISGKCDASRAYGKNVDGLRYASLVRGNLACYGDY